MRYLKASIMNSNPKTVNNTMSIIIRDMYIHIRAI